MIEVTEMYPRCLKRNADGESRVNISLDEIRLRWREGWYVGIYVDGWTEPWGCFVDGFDKLRARCPTAPKVDPIVDYVSLDGARFVGDIPEDPNA